MKARQLATPAFLLLLSCATASPQKGSKPAVQAESHDVLQDKTAKAEKLAQCLDAIERAPLGTTLPLFARCLTQAKAIAEPRCERAWAVIESAAPIMRAKR